MSKNCRSCGALQGDALTETVRHIGSGWKCACGWWNWLVRETTVCSTMFCYRRAKKTSRDPLWPSFCNRCKRRKKQKAGYKRKSRSERRKIKLGT